MPSMLAVVSLLACGDKDGDTAGGHSGIEADPDVEMAEALWVDMAGYESWGACCGWDGVQPSADGTHGSYVQIFVSDDAVAALEGGSEVPDGGILVKHGYDDAEGASHRGITAMKKVSGYASAQADWFWATYATDGTVTSAGEVDACTNCHAGKLDTDGDLVLFDDLAPGE